MYLYNYIHTAYGYCSLQDMIHYINPCPYTVIPLTPVSRVFNLFRTMGLRHLVVVDGCGLVSMTVINN